MRSERPLGRRALVAALLLAACASSELDASCNPSLSCRYDAHVPAMPRPEGPPPARTAVLPCSADGSCTIVQLALGGFHGCARDDAGGVLCWGVNDRGQIGGPPTSTREPPTRISLPHPALAIDSGVQHSCAALSTGEIWCWGNDINGQVSGASGVRLAAVAVDGVRDVTAPGLALRTSCALDEGRAWCWGDRLTIDEESDPRPRSLRGIFDATELAATWQAICARRTGGMVVCSGSEWLGDGRDAPHSLSEAITVRGLGDAVHLAAGPAHFCALRASGEVACWGRNGYGQLGNGTRATATAPVVVPGLARIEAIAAGGVGPDADDNAAHTCALDADGGVWCWGANDSGQLGDGTRVDRLTAGHAPLAGRERVVEIAAGGGVTCVRTEGGLVRCFGAAQPGFTVETGGDAGPGGSGG